MEHKPKYGFADYDTNTILGGGEELLREVVQGDLFKAEVTVHVRDHIGWPAHGAAVADHQGRCDRAHRLGLPLRSPRCGSRAAQRWRSGPSPCHEQLHAPIILIWDNLNTHVSKRMQAFVTAHADWLSVVRRRLRPRAQHHRGRLVAPQARAGQLRRHRHRPTRRAREDPAQTAVPLPPPA